MWLNRFLPLLDYPDWLFQGRLLAQLLRGDPVPGYELVARPVPNAASTLIVGTLGLVIPIETAGKLFLSLYVLLYLIGAWRLLHEGPFAAVPLPFVLGFSFFHGNVNYALSLAVLMLALAHVVGRRENVSRPLLAGLSLLLFVSHGASLIVLWLVAALFWLARPSRRVVARFAVGLAPGVVLFAAYALPRIVAGSAGVAESPPLDRVLKGKVASVAGYWAPFQGFYPFLDVDEGWLRVGAALNVAVVGALLGACALVWWRAARRRPRDTRLAATVAAFALLYLAAPVQIGDFGTPGERLLYPGLFLALALAAPSRRLAAVSSAVVAAVLSVQGAYYHVHGGHVADEMARLHAELMRVGLGERPVVVREDTFDHEGYFAARREKPFYLPTHEVLFRLPYYIVDGLPIFHTGLFVGTRPDAAPRSRSDALRQPAEPPTAVVILGQAEGNAAIARLYAPTLTPVLVDRRATVLKPP